MCFSLGICSFIVENSSLSWLCVLNTCSLPLIFLLDREAGVLLQLTILFTGAKFVILMLT